jgi:hypothetical protein
MPLDRRRFLIGSSVVIAGAAAAGVTIGVLPNTESAAADEVQRFSYRGRQVVATVSDTSAHVTVNGRHGIHVERIGDQYFTHLLPFGSFRSPRELVQAVIQAEDAHLLII